VANPYHHALSCVKVWGGTVEDYIQIHDWFDASNEHFGDFRHRALRHHSQGIYEAERLFGGTDHTITISTGRKIPVRWIAERHVKEDLGHIPSLKDWFVTIKPCPWMGKTEKIEAQLTEDVTCETKQTCDKD
jgi:hypothetical protein